MKIVHLVLSNVYAGIEQHVNELVLNLEQESKTDVIIICNKEIASRFDSNNIQVINNFSRRSPIGLIKLLLKIHKIKPDIIHTHGSKTTSIINVIKKFLPIKHVATAHGIKNKTSVYKKATKLITVSQMVKESIDASSVVINNWYPPIVQKPTNPSRANRYQPKNAPSRLCVEPQKQGHKGNVGSLRKIKRRNTKYPEQSGQ